MRTIRPVAQAAALCVALFSVACGEHAVSTAPPSSPYRIAVFRVSLTPLVASVRVGKSIQLAASPLDAAGLVLTSPVVEWSSSDPTVVTVTQTGVVLARSAGSATIVASAEDKSSNATLTVSPAPLGGLTVAPSAVALRIGQTAQPAITARDVEGTVVTNRTLTWSSFDNAVATVSSSGVITGVNTGTTLVTATAEGQSAVISVSVTPAPVSSVVLNPAVATISVGSQLQLAGTVIDASGSALTGRPITWSGTNAAVASVSTNGLVQAVGVGSVTITGTNDGKSGTSQITVLAAPVASVEIAPAATTVQAGGSAQLAATVRDRNGVVVTDRAVLWLSSNSAVATVSSSGLVSTINPGTATISASLDGVRGLATVTVIPVPIASVSLTPSTSALKVGQTLLLSATPRDASGNALAGRSISWSSNNSGIATVSSSGLVTAVGAGSATITATSEGVGASAVISVTAATAASVSVTPASPNLTVGQSVQLSAVAKDGSGATMAGSVAWSSASPSIATVSASGLVTGVAAGSTTVTATSLGQSGSVMVTVTAAPPIAPAPYAAPDLPRAQVDTRFITPSGRALRVPAGGSLQAAIDSARAGDEIRLASGATFSGNFALRRKTGTGWIVIRTDALDASLPAEGVRTSPSYASVLAKITSPNADPAITSEDAAAGYRIMNVEIVATASGYGLVRFGQSATSLSALPQDIILDRVYYHSAAGTGTPDVRGIDLNGIRCAVVDSYIDEVHTAGFEVQGILIWNGAGPFKIVNNHIAAAGENMMIGGVDPKIQNLRPSDITIQRNHFYKPIAWKGVWGGVKNSFELKNALRVLIEGNVFENNWVSGQDGFAIVLKSMNQDYGCPWCETSHVTFRLNKIMNAPAGVNLVQQITASNGIPFAPINNVLVQNNAFYNIGADGTNGRLFQLAQIVRNATFDHNTGFAPNQLLVLTGDPKPGTVMTNNLVANGLYGIFGDGGAQGATALSTFCPGYIFQKNVVIGASVALYPAGNFYPGSSTAVGFLNYAAADYRLSSTSPYRNAGTDGKDIGADFTALGAATAGVSIP
ncbi:MAG: Ig-like domain-containing protein [Gemmatimonadota bacterium]|nr:Ig-like domain-containing protein [Gemmatimonadota bacterium]